MRVPLDLQIKELDLCASHGKRLSRACAILPQMSREDVELVRALVPDARVDWAATVRDDELWQGLEEPSRTLFTSSFRCGLIGVTESWASGFDGLRAVWLEWLEPWASYRVQEEEIIDLDDGRVAWLGRDFGGRRDGRGEITLISSAIWTVEDGKISEAAFYAEREQCLRAAGLRG